MLVPPTLSRQTRLPYWSRCTVWPQSVLTQTASAVTPGAGDQVPEAVTVYVWPATTEPPVVVPQRSGVLSRTGRVSRATSWMIRTRTRPLLSAYPVAGTGSHSLSGTRPVRG